MSTKSSILLSDADEHWYFDVSDNTYNLEIGKEHEISDDEDGFFIQIKQDSPLGKAIRKMFIERHP